MIEVSYKLKNLRLKNCFFLCSRIWLLRASTVSLLAVGVIAFAQNDVKPPLPNPLASRNDSPQAGSTDQGSSPITSFPVQVVPFREAIISSEVSTLILGIPFKLGDSFRTGDILANLDCREIEAKHEFNTADAFELRARLEGANAEYRAALETHLTKLRLQALGAAGDLEVTLAAAGADKAKAAIKQMEAAVDKADANVKQSAAVKLHCVIVAPFDGRISRIRIKERELVAANQPVLDIVDVSNLKLQLFAPSNLARRITIGSTLSVRFNGQSKDRIARVTRINPKLDGASQLQELEAMLVAPPQELIAGMLGDARLLSVAKRLPLPDFGIGVVQNSESALEVAERAAKQAAAERQRSLNEAKRLAAEQAAERKRKAAEEKAEKDRLAAEVKAKADAEKAEKARRAAEEKAKAAELKKEQQRLAAEQAAERKRKAAEEKTEKAQLAAEEKARYVTKSE